FEGAEGNHLGCLERERTGEDRESREELLQFRREQVVAPLDRRPERPLMGGRVACSIREERQSVIEPLQQRALVERAQPCSRELESERQAVQPAADLHRAVVRYEIASDRARALDEELDRVVLRRRIDRVLTLPV